MIGPTRCRTQILAPPERTTMRAIKFAAPKSVNEAVALLQAAGARARILAGGTDLIPQVASAARDTEVFVDGKRIPELMALEFDPSRGLSLGAAVPCYQIYANEEIRSR